jgi:hypothetical protein
MYKLTIAQEGFNEISFTFNKLAEIQAVLNSLAKEPGTKFIIEVIEPGQETEEDDF